MYIKKNFIFFNGKVKPVDIIIHFLAAGELEEESWITQFNLIQSNPYTKNEESNIVLIV